MSWWNKFTICGILLPTHEQNKWTNWTNLKEIDDRGSNHIGTVIDIIFLYGSTLKPQNPLLWGPHQHRRGTMVWLFNGETTRLHYLFGFAYFCVFLFFPVGLRLGRTGLLLAPASTFKRLHLICHTQLIHSSPFCC